VSSQPDNWLKARRVVTAVVFSATLSVVATACGNNGGIPTTPPTPTPTPQPSPGSSSRASSSTQYPRPNALQSPVAFSASTSV